MLRASQPAKAILEHDLLERIVRLDVNPALRIQGVVPLSRAPGSPAPVDAVLRLHLDDDSAVVLKIRSGEGQTVFDAESRRLSFLAEKGLLPVPRVLALRKDGEVGPFTYMVLTHLPGVRWDRFQCQASRSQRQAVETELGDVLGKLHAAAAPNRFGEAFPEDSPRFLSWPEFFSRLWDARVAEVVRAERLDTATLDAIDWIYENLSVILTTKQSPRFVHGNLSGAKIICDEQDGEWRVSGFLDPAVWYGHSELDLALIDLLCGVGSDFFESYSRHVPVEEGFDLRKQVYMLYHILDSIRLYGNTHHILTAMDITRQILQRCGC